MRKLLLALLMAFLPQIASAAPPAAVDDATAIEAPGPSLALFNAPFYRCVRNVYVSPTGSDAAAGTAAAPWRTLQRADATAAAGTCVNVAPGTYTAGVNIHHGGNAATPTGYVVYRCQVMDQCKITAVGGTGMPAFTMINAGGGPNYIVIDGFELAAASKVAYGVGIFTNNNLVGLPTPTPGVHHLWALNNIVHGFGQAGINTNESDWLFVLHNTTYDNANVTCDAQGSGIGIVVSKKTPNYAPTAEDQRFAPFHQVISWNISYDNKLTKCGVATNPYDTDGNGIIIDTLNGEGIDDVLYPDQTLVANNIVYANGAKGIAVFRSSYVTVANNTSYSNNLDPFDQGFPRGEINNAGGIHNTFVNNIAYATPATNTSDLRCQGMTRGPMPAPCPLMGNVAFLGGDSPKVKDSDNSWSNNIAFGGTTANIWGSDPFKVGVAFFNADVFSCRTNKCNVDPKFTAPASGDFALSPDSPAIGYGATQPYLPATAVDAGACPHSLTHCPGQAP
ncbi:MAG TPA: DUF1565 domain-containing protein [Rhodopila sp.]|uniref:DUF1565 domain-containing protein n=1 Tax=Rhodopila sp. TaxID=2480087 RepID=UPI002CBC3769|nr:DUF1565 domain-containing protein [Rhodopila sp.]HVY15139.1 DUF1565 domain-containing protein [Rhodopila sp.]